MPLKVICQQRIGIFPRCTLNAKHATSALHLAAHSSTVSAAVLLILLTVLPRRCVSGPRYLLRKQSPGCVVVVTVVIVTVVSVTDVVEAVVVVVIVVVVDRVVVVVTVVVLVDTTAKS